MIKIYHKEGKSFAIPRWNFHGWNWDYRGLWRCGLQLRTPYHPVYNNQWWKNNVFGSFLRDGRNTFMITGYWYDTPHWTCLRIEPISGANWRILTRKRIKRCHELSDKWREDHASQR